MIKISICNEERGPLPGRRTDMYFSVEIRFRSDKERDVVWSKLKGRVLHNPQWKKNFPCLASLINIRRSNVDDAFLLFLFTRSSPELMMGIVECCKRDVEGLLMNAAIKGDLNTK